MKCCHLALLLPDGIRRYETSSYSSQIVVSLQELKAVKTRKNGSVIRKCSKRQPRGSNRRWEKEKKEILI